MNSEIIHKIERIEKMLYMLLNEKQRKEIKKFDKEYLKQKKIEAESELLRGVNKVWNT